MLRRQTSDLSPQCSPPSGRHASFSSLASQGSTTAYNSPELSLRSSGSVERPTAFEARSASFAHRRESRERAEAAPAQESSRLWLVPAFLLVAAMCSGFAIMYFNQYSYIHKHIDREYNTYVKAWQASELTEFYNTKWMLIIDDQHTVNLQRTADATKNQEFVLGASLRRNLTTHVAFTAGALIPYVFFPASGLEAADRQRDPNEWKAVKPEMYNHQNFRLKGVHEASGAISWVTLDDYPFVRKGEQLKGLGANECQRKDGLWNLKDSTCTLMEFLSEVCIRVTVDAMSPDPHYYDVDRTHAGAGCYPEDGLKIPQYTRLPLGHVQGEQDVFYLPQSARNATRMVVRHAHDPELMEKVLRNELRAELDHKTLRFSLGVLIVCAAFIMAVPILLRAWPSASRMYRQMYLRWKFPNSIKEDSFSIFKPSLAV